MTNSDPVVRLVPDLRIFPVRGLDLDQNSLRPNICHLLANGLFFFDIAQCRSANRSQDVKRTQPFIQKSELIWRESLSQERPGCFHIRALRKVAPTPEKRANRIRGRCRWPGYEAPGLGSPAHHSAQANVLGQCGWLIRHRPTGGYRPKPH